MPCAAPSRNNLRVQGPCGIPDVYAGGICKWHWQMQNGLIRPSGLDPQTVLLLHGESMTDAAGHPITAVGDAKVDSAQSKFGGSSYAFDGAGDYLTIPDSPDWDLGAGDFTIDFWIRQPVIATCLPVANYIAASKGWQVYLTTTGFYFYYSVDGTTALNKLFGTHGMAVNTWCHLAAVRSGNNLLGFVNGVQLGATQDLTGVAIWNSTAPLSIGADGAGGAPVNGWLDEIRISKGIARWTAPFSPPTAPY